MWHGGWPCDLVERVLSPALVRASATGVAGALARCGTVRLVPRLRWVWRPTRDDAATTAYTLGVSAVLAFALVWFARFQVWNPVALPNEVYQSSDHPYLLSLAAELKHHFPPQVPFVSGEPLYYHWFSFGDAANAAWTTGLELDLLVFRMLPRGT